MRLANTNSRNTVLCLIQIFSFCCGAVNGERLAQIRDISGLVKSIDRIGIVWRRIRSFLTSFFTEKGEETKVAEAANAEKGRETKAAKAADAEKTKAAKAADAEAMEVAKKIDPQLNLDNPDYKRELRQLVLNLQEIIRQRRIHMAKKKQVVRGGMERAYLKRHPDETALQAREFCSKNYRVLHGKGAAATYDYLTQRNIKVHVDHFLKNIAKLRTKK